VTDHVPSDHGAVDSHRVHLTQVGRTHRLQVELPATLDCAVDDVVSLSLEGDARHAQVTAGLDGEPTIQGAFATPRLARTRGEGEDELRAWVDEHGLGAGDALVLDVLREGYAYGLRRPGERVVYSPPEPPDSTLSDIARDLGTE